jgi:hypothetical protein
MLTGLWTIGIKVPDIERELEFHRRIGNSVVLDETIEFQGESFRLPLVKMGDKYLHLMEKAVYESLLDEQLPCGLVHLVYRSDSFEKDLAILASAGAKALQEPVVVSAGFGKRRLAFFRAPGGWNFEILEMITNLVPEV